MKKKEKTRNKNGPKDRGSKREKNRKQNSFLNLYELVFFNRIQIIKSF